MALEIAARDRQSILQLLIAYGCVAATLVNLSLVAAAEVVSTIHQADKDENVMMRERTFGEDVAFLERHVETIVLQEGDSGARVAIVPAYQGRVMTSSTSGDAGLSFGWINYDQVAAGFTESQINVFGGEERFWLGPEGGQYSIFFSPGAAFEFAQWKTPLLIDSEAYPVVARTPTMVAFRKEATIGNYSSTSFELRIDRSIELLTEASMRQSLNVDPAAVSFIGYRTTNRVTNIGKRDWQPDSGLLSMWLLGMYKPGPDTTVVVPYHEGSERDLGIIVNDTYFGKVPADRLKIEAGVLFFAGDGKHRSKIGLSPRRAKDICGSFDAERKVLTVVKYRKPIGATDYVNSMWELQDNPYAGDAINAYNDGPPEPGAEPLGPFYELETSSPALALKAGQTGEHVQGTYHFSGSEAQLDNLAKQLFGVDLDTIRSALK